MDFTTQPTEELLKGAYKGIISHKIIEVSPHALDHLSEKQRKVFKEDELIHMVERENSRKTYLQTNGRYAAYFRKTDGYRKIILELNNNKITIVTFMDILEIPKVKLK